LALEVEAVRETGATSMFGLAQGLTARGVPTPQGSRVWTHTTVARVLNRINGPRLGGSVGCPSPSASAAPTIWCKKAVQLPQQAKQSPKGEAVF
jgi:hypothetical protein